MRFTDIGRFGLIGVGAIALLRPETLSGYPPFGFPKVFRWPHSSLGVAFLIDDAGDWSGWGPLDFTGGGYSPDISMNYCQGCLSSAGGLIVAGVTYVVANTGYSCMDIDHNYFAPVLYSHILLDSTNIRTLAQNYLTGAPINGDSAVLTKYIAVHEMGHALGIGNTMFDNIPVNSHNHPSYPYCADDPFFPPNSNHSMNHRTLPWGWYLGCWQRGNFSATDGHIPQNSVVYGGGNGIPYLHPQNYDADILNNVIYPGSGPFNILECFPVNTASY